MTSKLLLGTAFGLGLILTLFSGCSSTESTQTSRSAREQVDQSEQSDGHTAHDHGASDSGQTDMEKMKEALADLPEEDRQSAMKQHFCPVSSEMLGTVGPPEKVAVNGRMVWICCNGCRDELLADPDKYLATLGN